MTPEFPPNNPRAELEARLTAFILGELPAHDAAALRQIIDDDPELAALYDRLNAAHKLVREAVATPTEPAKESSAPLRLSEARRQKLLAQFKTVKPKEFAPSKPKTSPVSMVLMVAAVLAITAMLAGLLLPSLAKSKAKAIRFSVANNLKQIDIAKRMWADENNKSPEDTPTAGELAPYLGGSSNGGLPRSVEGETYRIGKVGESPVAELAPNTPMGKRQRQISLYGDEQAAAQIINSTSAPAPAGTQPTFGIRVSNQVYSYNTTPAPAAVPNQSHDFDSFEAQKTPRSEDDNAHAVSPLPPPAKTTIVLPPVDNSGNDNVSFTWNTFNGSTQPPSQSANSITTVTPLGAVDTSDNWNVGDGNARTAPPARPARKVYLSELSDAEAKDVLPKLENLFSSKNAPQNNIVVNNGTITSPATDYVGTLNAQHMAFGNGVTASGAAGGSVSGNMGVSGTNSYAGNIPSRLGYLAPSGEIIEATNFVATTPYSLGLSTNNSTVQAGDPEWIGYLEHPDQRHSASNLFLSRGAFVAIPPQDSLDANYIHNQAKVQPKPPVSTSASVRGFYNDTYNADGVSATNSIAPDVIVGAKFADVNQQGNGAAGFNWTTGNGNLGPNLVASGGTQPSFNNTTPAPSPADGMIAGPTTLRNPLKTPTLGTITGIYSEPQFTVGARKQVNKAQSPRAAAERRLTETPELVAGQNETDASAPTLQYYTLRDAVPYVTGTYFGGINGQASSQYSGDISKQNSDGLDNYAPPPPAKRAESPRAAASDKSPSGRVNGFVNGEATGSYSIVRANGTSILTDGNLASIPTPRGQKESKSYFQGIGALNNGTFQNPQQFVETTPKTESNPPQPQVKPAPATDDLFALASQAQAKKDYRTADAELSSIVAEHPRNARALDALRENKKLLDQNEGHIPSQELIQQIPAWHANEIQTATAIQDGKLLYEAGKLDEAKDKLDTALKADPGNVAATQYRKLVQEKQTEDATRRGELHSVQGLAEVEKAWNPQPVSKPAEAGIEIGGNLGGSREPIPVRSLNTPGLASAQPGGDVTGSVATNKEQGTDTNVFAVNVVGYINITNVPQEIAANRVGADGSVQQFTVNGFRSFANHAGDATTAANTLAFPGDEPKIGTDGESAHPVGYVNLLANQIDVDAEGKKEAASLPTYVSTNGVLPSTGQRTSGFNDRLKSLGLKSAGIGSSGKVVSADTTFDDSVKPLDVAGLPKTPKDKVPQLGDIPLIGRTFRSDGNTNTTAEPILHAGEIDFPDVPLDQFLDVYGKLTGRTILRGPNLPNAKVNLVSQTDLTKSEAIQAFDSVLAMNGISVVNVGSNFVKAVPVAVVGTLGERFSTNQAGEELVQNQQHQIPIHYAKASDISEALKTLSADKEKDGHSQAYREKLAELERLRHVQEAMALQAAEHSVDLKMPTTVMTEIIEHADGKPSQNSGLGQRIGRMFTGKETQIARIKVERDVTDVPGVRGQPTLSGVYDPYFVQTQFEAIQSDKVLDQVIDKLNLDQAWAAQKGSTVPLKRSETLKLLKKNLEVIPAKNTSLVDIKVKSDKPEEAAKIANTIAEVYQDVRREQHNESIENGIKPYKDQLAAEQKKIAQVELELDELRKTEKVVDEDVPVVKHSTNAPIPQPEITTAENAFSTFSLNISDVSLKLAAASLEKGQMPDASTIRSEEFINAFDYRDPEPAPGAPLGFAWERAQYPFAHNRDLLRFAVKTAATGRDPGRPLNIVLLLDKSGSMERADRVRIIHEALRVLATQLQPQDKISVVTFARVARLWVDGLSGSQAGEVADGLDQLTPEGGTNLEEAMRLAYETARRHYMPNGVNRVVLLTDGAANLGNVDPDALKVKVEEHRKEGIALDCFGIGWEGYNDDLLEVLSRNGGGRYGFINTPEEAATDFAGQLAGALNVAAYDVKVQVEFNPKRVTNWRQIGYAKHQLTKEQFRDNTVKAAQIAAAESGNGLYAIEVNPNGEGPIATVRVRYRVPGTEDYPEHEYQVPYTGGALPLEQSSSAMRLMGSASAFSEWLASSPFAGEVTTDKLLGLMSGVPETYGADERPKKLEWMIRQAKSLEGK